MVGAEIEIKNLKNRKPCKMTVLCNVRQEGAAPPHFARLCVF